MEYCKCVHINSVGESEFLGFLSIPHTNMGSCRFMIEDYDVIDVNFRNMVRANSVERVLFFDDFKVFNKLHDRENR